MKINILFGCVILFLANGTLLVQKVAVVAGDMAYTDREWWRLQRKAMGSSVRQLKPRSIVKIFDFGLKESFINEFKVGEFANATFNMDGSKLIVAARSSDRKKTIISFFRLRMEQN